MNSNILVSVVIPAYNSEEYISLCLDATIGQTYPNIEILIVDDGSTDSTYEISKRYALADKRIRLFSASGKGVSAARNCGISNSNGKYIVFFDTDDLPERNIIECFLHAIEEWSGKCVSYITCGMYFESTFYKNVDDAIIVLEKCYGYVEGENYLLNRSHSANLAWLKLFNFVTNKIYDNEFIKNNEIYFDENVCIGEDLMFNLKYLSKKDGYIGMINKPLYHYIKRTNKSLTSTYHKNDIEDTKTVYRFFLDWESEQEGVTEDNMLVVKSIFLTDWTRRLSTMAEAYVQNSHYSKCRKTLNTEIRSHEFQSLLNEVRRAKKISWVRYFALKTGSFGIFALLRRLYQITKG